MREKDREQLLSNLQFTHIHVGRVNELLSSYHRIHRVPFNSLTAILSTLLILLLLWGIGLTHVIHTVGEKVANSMVTLENSEYLPVADEVETSDDALAEEDKPLVDISFITDVFAKQSKYSASGVFFYSLIVALFDTLFIIGLAIGISYGGFYLYHIIKVEKNKTKLQKIVSDIKQELTELQQSFIPQEYWHLPYLSRMIRFVEQDRVDDLRSCLDLMDLEIRHKQIVDALAQDQVVDPQIISDVIKNPKERAAHQNNERRDDDKSTNLVMK